MSDDPDIQFSVDDLVAQRKIYRTKITKMFNQLSVLGTMPEIDTASSLYSDYEDIILELEEHNVIDDNVHMDKLKQILKFINLYVQIDDQTSQNISSSYLFNQCQQTINELNKMTTTFSAAFGLICKLQAKLDSSSLAPSTPISMNPEANVGSNRSSTPLSGSTANANPNRSPTPDNIANNSIVVANRSMQNIQPLLRLSPISTSQSPPINNVLNHGHPMKVKAEDMPKFNGSAIQWPEFKDAALELIVNNTLIPTANSKFRRLFSALPLEAQTRIRNQRENPNFATIFNILDKFYGSPAIIIKELTSKIYSLPYLRLDAGPSLYAKYYDLLLNVRSIKLNEGDARTILSHVLNKMDVEHRRRAFQQTDNSNEQEYITLANVEEYFRKITTTDILINQVTTSNVNNKINRPLESHKTLVTSSSNDSNLTCIFCQQHHRHSLCPTSVDEKFEVLKKERRCFKCTNKNHGSRECNRTYICHKCKGNHITFLCRTNQSTTPSSSSSSSVGTSQSSSSSNPSSETIIENQSVNTALAKTGGSSQYLQTLTTKINNIKTRVIFDGGSELSFISNKLVKLLNLPKFKSVPIRINGYGGHHGRLIGHHFTIIKLPDRDGNITEIKLIIDDTVCHFKFNVLPTMIQSYVNKVFNIDFNDENIPTDILFGNSDINRLKVLAMDKNFGSLIIGKTSLGYIVHGQTDDAKSMVVGCLTENHDLPIESMIQINKTILVSDSKVNVQRLTNDINKYPQCVAVHLYNIRNKIDAIHWVAGKRNPSDFLTRGASPEQLMDIQVLNIELLQEIYSETNQCSSLLINISNKIQSDIIINQSLTYEKWIELAKQHICQITDQSLDPLTMLIRLNQQYFIDEINKFPNVYLDDNCVIRCNTRLDNSDLDFDCKNPIFIPKSSFLEALVTKIHQNIGHGSLYRTMCEFRETYFTPKLRQMVKKLINKCTICQINKAKPWEALIKSTKRALYGIVWRKELNSENFRTILYELAVHLCKKSGLYPFEGGGIAAELVKIAWKNSKILDGANINVIW
ncbi:hypothetical protein DERP_014982 [Dermatophagoides pteronyssinus]|uniref:Uncharacterized protein n=1 Tax=Dermatophagoides pteronyssinus TaxID=6956 RepID=A0ABQ8JWZ2_DERPT|nr:hypothetical protein DERP_014982 [Dermatophagoides pteronyssinus]